MLQSSLLAVKGKLLEYVFIMYKDMNTDERGVDYQEFYLESKVAIKEIQSIDTLNDLEKFCEDYGFNDLEGELSFPNLVKEAYKCF
jgi:hypothetical protein